MQLLMLRASLGSVTLEDLQPGSLSLMHCGQGFKLTWGLWFAHNCKLTWKWRPNLSLSPKYTKRREQSKPNSMCLRPRENCFGDPVIGHWYCRDFDLCSSILIGSPKNSLKKLVKISEDQWFLNPCVIFFETSPKITIYKKEAYHETIKNESNF